MRCQAKTKEGQELRYGSQDRPARRVIGSGWRPQRRFPAPLFGPRLRYGVLQPGGTPHQRFPVPHGPSVYYATFARRQWENVPGGPSLSLDTAYAPNGAYELLLALEWLVLLSWF
ncbi:hypothetical protein NDU88_007075 [Pleurodeles waltl]|uniref:Uncharacterized protein n=1 Tax=Pleurodeles waltl TaxID=8319 RepID=A0AAV7PKR8_PLEWA|nr:hypothetical protein NDU88_007075 [Pleurodeles waltl]